MDNEIRYPSLKQVERLYRQIVSLTGGEYGYLSKSNLEYILDTVKDVGERFHKKQALVRKAAFLLYNIITIHPFINGNKRIGYVLAKIFLQLNGYRLEPQVGEAYGFLLKIAEGKVSAKDVEEWIARNLTRTNRK